MDCECQRVAVVMLGGCQDIPLTLQVSMQHSIAHWLACNTPIHSWLSPTSLTLPTLQLLHRMAGVQHQLSVEVSLIMDSIQTTVFNFLERISGAPGNWCVYLSVQMCTCVCMYIVHLCGVQKSTSSVISLELPTLSFQGLSLVWNSSRRLGCLGREPLSAVSLLFSRAEIPSVCHWASLLMRLLRKSSSLSGKCFLAEAYSQLRHASLIDLLNRERMPTDVLLFLRLAADSGGSILQHDQDSMSCTQLGVGTQLNATLQCFHLEKETGAWGVCLGKFMTSNTLGL